MELEKNIEAYLTKQITKLGGVCVKLQGTKGLPDRLCILPGNQIFFVELKTKTGRTSKIQEYTIRKLKNLDCQVFIINSKEGVDYLCYMIIKKKP